MSASARVVVQVSLGTLLQSTLADTKTLTSASASASNDDPSPQVWSSGYSPKADFLEAVQEATEIAMAGLPKGGAKIDLALVSVSSLYDGQASPAILVPAVVSTASTYGSGIQNLIGCTTGGIISSVRNNYYGCCARRRSHADHGGESFALHVALFLFFRHVGMSKKRNSSI